jgi:16S rRNA (cytosine1402-N4)-methyltransferase
MSRSEHTPVLLQECIDLLQPAPGKRIVDGTFGFGGHSRLLLSQGADVLGLDLDDNAMTACGELAAEEPRLLCQRKSFMDMPAAIAEAGWAAADGILLDLGVSSLQLDAPEKGFTYRLDAPLDMRFDQRHGATAADLLATLGQKDLADLIWKYGEERGSRRIAAAVVRQREAEPLHTTGQLRDLVAGLVPAQQRNACLSRVFQALRIAVNDEMGALAATLAAIPGILAPGGRAVVISYHSLEDRQVKTWLATENRDCLCPPILPICQCGHKRSMQILTRKPVSATNTEIRMNPRARSARLRAGERIS